MSRLTCRGLAELDYLHAITDLLLRARAEDLQAGLWEAADLQWWWRDEGWDDPEGQLFWRDEQGVAVAALLRFDDGQVLDCDLSWLPSARQLVVEDVWPDALRRVSTAARRCRKPATLLARDDDEEWQRALGRHGFAPDGPVLVQLERLVPRPPTALSLPEGFTLHDAREEETRPHHLERRNGPGVMHRLRQCSLYRPDLDLVVCRGDDVAAYCLAWLDPSNHVGLFEPVRTEDAFQGRGLAAAMMTEGLRRLVAAGARVVRVSHREGNEPAERLYRRLGFRPTFRRLTWRLAGAAS